MLKDIFKPTRVKILFDLIISILYLIIIFSIPAWGYGQKLSNLTIFQLILSLFISFILVAIVYYPLTCGLFGIYRSIRKSVNYRYLTISFIIVLIFNPFSFHLISKLFTKNNQPLMESQITEYCGLEVVSFSEFSKAQNSGLIVGDNITSVDGSKINSVNDLIQNTQKKRPGDITNLETNRGIFKIEIVRDPVKNGPVLGIKFKDANCG